MGEVSLHNATTTKAVSQTSLADLAELRRFNPNRVLKWERRDFLHIARLRALECALNVTALAEATPR